ncbi:hypothetical protein [Lactococcus lactis]|uniref:hypothetical protein n=1 Tax=Lactococcus lactis TaxID=1358 RepID=UPI00288DAFBA|nr:hypothetical protein [Lactococcus lactis]MDT2926813.1 hypothetical protein [Lactococcus lactis]
MTIVAKNSLTISNVNDGTITHYAYANSADGKDGFYVGGGTNLLINSNFSSGLANWHTNLGNNKDGKAVVTTDSDGDTCIHITGTGASCGLYSSPSPFNQNQITTGSVLAKGTGIIQVVGLESRLTSNFGIVSTESYSKVGSTTQASSNTNAFVVYFSPVNNVVDVYIKFVKLEQGDKATPWSPAPSEAHPSYIGQYTDFNTTASTDPAKYAPWIIFKGNDGKDGIAGKDGNGIKTTVITYAGSTNGTTAPTTGWSPSVPSVPAGQFLWTKTVWRYYDNTSETGYSVAKMGNTGATGPAGPPGSTGAPGKIVSNTEPISLFKGLTWKYSGTANLTASDGTVIHPNTEYYYNGTHWMINYLSANNFEANSITADLIDAKNLTITDGEFVSTIIDGSVKTQTEIKDDHLMIYKMDTSHNDITTIALKSDSGLGMTYQNSDTSQYTSSGINLQGIFTQDNILKNGVSLTPGGVKFTQNGVSAGLNFDGTNLSSSMPIQAPNTIVKSTYFSVSGIGIRLDRMMSFVAVTFSGQASSTINTSPTINNVLPVGFRPISPYSIDYMVPGNVANSGYIYFNPDGSIRIMATINKGYYIRGTRLYITSDVYPS